MVVVAVAVEMSSVHFSSDSFGRDGERVRGIDIHGKRILGESYNYNISKGGGIPNGFIW